MAITIISVKEKKGTYEGRDYHNFNIFGLILDSANEQVVAGGEVKELKIKAAAFIEALTRNIKALNNPKIQQVKDIVGLYIKPDYNEWGNVEDFTLAVPESHK